MSKVSDLLTSSTNLLQEIRGVESQFSRSVTVHATKYLFVLEPESYQWEDIWLNLYMPSEIPQTAPVGTTVIIHGHSKDKTCFASTFCHVLGFIPKDGGNKFWKQKWGTMRYVITATNLSVTTKPEESTTEKKTRFSATFTRTAG